MSDQMLIPTVELNGSFIRITQISNQQERSTLTIPVEAVDEFCESLYWARKEHLTRQNEAARAAENDLPINDQSPENLSSR